MNLGAEPFVLINPEIVSRSPDTFLVWDDCLSVPDVLVRVRRHCSISLVYRDHLFRQRSWRNLPPDLSELVQHEVDHLDGVLMTERAEGDDGVQPLARWQELVGSARPVHRLSLANIAEASSLIDPVFTSTPQFECEPLSAALGVGLTLKVETLNPIRSFKGRGASYFVRKSVLAGAASRTGFVCASAGNFGQGLAYAGRAQGLPVTVFAALGANPRKLARMRALGADVRLAGRGLRRREGRRAGPGLAPKVCRSSRTASSPGSPRARARSDASSWHATLPSTRSSCPWATAHS